ncbi:MAG: hypothetical protein NTY00_05815 [Deltaproteobacteria bacterium]|nr:hypothetical protein [Deltaproteobacteria bacterium]
MKSTSKRSPSLLVPLVVLILVAAGAFWFFFHRGTSQPPPQPPAVTEGLQTNPPSTTLADETLIPGTPGSPQNQVVPAPIPALPTKDDLPQAVEKIKAFYQYLDQQKYIQARHLDAPSLIYITRLIQKLLDAPPIVTRETDELSTILKNSTHLFRILGKDNILLSKEILNREQDKKEELMANYFLLTEHPDAFDKDLSLKIPEGALYQYACFFLNTMGGKLYLSRRDSLTRMLVSYYAILIVHQANTQGKNTYGLQLQPAIDLLTTEIEEGGNHLHYKEAYLDTLYDLKEKYQ